MAGGGGGGDNLIEDINVTPLVDIMLCLMVIFMIAAALVVAAPKAIEVDLPKASSGRSVEEPSTFAVVYDEKEQVYVNGEKMSWEAFRAEVRRRKAEDEKAGCDLSLEHALVRT